MSERIKARIPVTREGAERSARDPDYRQYLRTKAVGAMQDLADTRGRIVASDPELVDIVESRLSETIVYFDFEADTRPR